MQKMQSRVTSKMSNGDKFKSGDSLFEGGARQSQQPRDTDRPAEIDMQDSALWLANYKVKRAGVLGNGPT